MGTCVNIGVYARLPVLTSLLLAVSNSNDLSATQTTRPTGAVPVLVACMHAPRARSPTLSARTRPHALRATASALPPPVLPLPPIITPWPTVSTHRLPCVFRCFGKRMAKQALGYVHTWVGAASASTGLPLPVSATGSGRVLPRLWPGCWGAGPTSRYSR